MRKKSSKAKFAAGSTNGPGSSHFPAKRDVGTLGGAAADLKSSRQ